VDIPRKRISLTLRLEDDHTTAAADKPSGRREPRPQQKGQRRDAPPAPANSAMADALRRAGLNR
jgi:uncharacterized protein